MVGVDLAGGCFVCNSVLNLFFYLSTLGDFQISKRKFRKYYANLIELRSLLGNNISFALFTASRNMELKIFESIGLTLADFVREAITKYVSFS